MGDEFELTTDAVIGSFQAEIDLRHAIECLALGYLENAPERAWVAILGPDALGRVGLAFKGPSSPVEAFTAFVAWTQKRTMGQVFEVLARALRGEVKA